MLSCCVCGLCYGVPLLVGEIIVKKIACGGAREMRTTFLDREK